MSFRFSSAAPSSRRGYTVIEALVAGALTTLSMLGLAAVMSFAGTLDTTVNLSNDTNQAAVKALARMTQAVREAVKVNIVNSRDFKIYYPTTDASGRYDLTKPDYTYWVEFLQTDAAGNPSASGSCLWKKTSTNPTGQLITNNLRQFSASYFPAGSDDSIRLTIEIRKTLGTHTGDTLLSQRVLYLRNYYAGS